MMIKKKLFEWELEKEQLDTYILMYTCYKHLHGIALWSFFFLNSTNIVDTFLKCAPNSVAHLSLNHSQSLHLCSHQVIVK